MENQEKQKKKKKHEIMTSQTATETKKKNQKFVSKTLKYSFASRGHPLARVQ